MSSQSKLKKLPPYFNYEPLQDGWIRLVAIQNARDASELGEKLNIRFVASPLDTCPLYTALSYTWGDPNPVVDPCTTMFSEVLRCYPVHCNDQIVLVSRNLRDALRRIRQYQTWRSNEEEMFERYSEPKSKALLERVYGDSTYLWIDALCIDQDDLHERSQQVCFMSRIYMQASHTIVWLGELDEYTQSAQSFLSKVALNVGVEISKNNHVPRPTQGKQKYLGANYLGMDEKVAFVAIMSRNWFFRMWVLQECVLSRRLGVLLGDICFNYQLLLSAVNVECVNDDHGFIEAVFNAAKMHPMLASSILSETTFNSVSMLVRIGQFQEQVAKGRLPDFLSVITSCGSSKAGNPRDKIYAILGIASEFSSDKIDTYIPDYAKPVEQVFVEATHHVMQVRKDLAVLSLISPGTTIKGLPSWCPDYSSRNRVLRVFGEQGNIWKSGEIWMHSPTFELLADMKLRVEGTHVDTVIECTPIDVQPLHSTSPNSPARLEFGIAGMCALASRLDLSKSRYSTHSDQSRVEVLWRTIILDEIKGVSPAPREVGQGFPDFIEFFLLKIISHHLKDDSSNRAFLLSEKAVHDYVEELIAHLETLVTMERFDSGLLLVSTRIRELLKVQIGLRSINSNGENYPHELLNVALDSVPLTRTLGLQDIVADPTAPEFLALKGLSNHSKASASEMPQSTFIQAFTSLMKANLARLCSHTLALTQAIMLPFDEIWILHGAPAPICLRPTSQGRYRCLGEVYVHGIMSGEASSSYGPLTTVILE